MISFQILSWAVSRNQDIPTLRPLNLLGTVSVFLNTVNDQVVKLSATTYQGSFESQLPRTFFSLSFKLSPCWGSSLSACCVVPKSVTHGLGFVMAASQSYSTQPVPFPVSFIIKLTRILIISPCGHNESGGEEIYRHSAEVLCFFVPQNMPRGWDPNSFSWRHCFLGKERRVQLPGNNTVIRKMMRREGAWEDFQNNVQLNMTCSQKT